MAEELVLIENWKEVANEILENDSTELIVKSLRDMARNGMKVGFSSNMQTLITQVALMVRKIVESPKTETKYYNDAIRYLCKIILNNDAMYYNLINMNKNNTIVSFTIDDSSTDIAGSVKLYNELIIELKKKFDVPKFDEYII